MTYTPENVWAVIRDWQRVFCIGARFSAREEKLSTKPPPAHEAAFAGTSTVIADMAAAIQSLPPDLLTVVLLESLRTSSWRTSNMDMHRLRIADYMDVTPGEVTKMLHQAVRHMVERLNGVDAVTELPAGVTV